MRRVRGTLGLVVPRGTLGPSGRVAERSGSWLRVPGQAALALRMQAEASLQVLALLSQPVAAPYRSVLAGPAAGAQGPGWALPGAKAGLHPHRAAGASVQLQPGVPVQLRHERRLPRPPLWPRAVELSAGFTIGRARAHARGPRRLRSFHPHSRAPMELPG